MPSMFSYDPYIVRITPNQLKLIRTFYTVPIDQSGKFNVKKRNKKFIKKIVQQFMMNKQEFGLRLNRLSNNLKTPELLPKEPREGS